MHYIIVFIVLKVISLKFLKIKYSLLNSFSIEVIKASEHDYLSTISELQINSQYAAAFMNGRIQLHMVRIKF